MTHETAVYILLRPQNTVAIWECFPTLAQAEAEATHWPAGSIVVHKLLVRKPDTDVSWLPDKGLGLAAADAKREARKRPSSGATFGGPGDEA